LPERISENAEKLQCARDPSNPSLLALVGGGPRQLTLPLRACAGWARFRWCALAFRAASCAPGLCILYLYSHLWACTPTLQAGGAGASTSGASNRV